MKRLDRFLEKKIDLLFTWAGKYRYKIFLFSVLSSLVIILSFFPYLNLFLDKSVLIFLIFTFASILFQIRAWQVIFIGILLLVLAAVLHLVGVDEGAETAADLLYGVFVVGTLKAIFENG